MFLRTLYSLACNPSPSAKPLSDSDKAVLVAVVREDRATEALSLLDEKFRTIKGGKGIAYTVPMDSVIGVAIYRFLADLDA